MQKAAFVVVLLFAVARGDVPQQLHLALTGFEGEIAVQWVIETPY